MSIYCKRHYTCVHPGPIAKTEIFQLYVLGRFERPGDVETSSESKVKSWESNSPWKINSVKSTFIPFILL